MENSGNSSGVCKKERQKGVCVWITSEIVIETKHRNIVLKTEPSELSVPDHLIVIKIQSDSIE